MCWTTVSRREARRRARGGDGQHFFTWRSSAVCSGRGAGSAWPWHRGRARGTNKRAVHLCRAPSNPKRHNTTGKSQRREASRQQQNVTASTQRRRAAILSLVLGAYGRIRVAQHITTLSPAARSTRPDTAKHEANAAGGGGAEQMKISRPPCSPVSGRPPSWQTPRSLSPCRGRPPATSAAAAALPCGAA